MLVDRLGLAGQRGFLDPQVRDLDQAQVGRHDRAGVEVHDVAGHELRRRDLDRAAGATGLDHRHRHLAERGDGPLGPVLLEEAEQREQHDDRTDRAGLEELAEQRATAAPRR